VVRLWRLPFVCTCSSPRRSRRWGALIAAGLLLVFGWGCGKEKEPLQEGSGRPETAVAEAPDTSGVVAGEDPRLQNIDFLRRQPPSTERSIALGTYFLERGQADSALVHYQDAEERDPKSPRPWNFVGITLSRLDRYDEAVAAYRKAIELDPFYVKTHINLGNVLLRQDKTDEAIKAYRVATRVDSTEFLAWLNLGLAYERKTGKRTGAVSSETDQEAIKAYMRAIKCDDSRPEPWERLGWIYFDQKYYKPARERWTEAVRRDPSRDDLRDNIERLEAYAESTHTQ
jgi:tetratricopeptide (TPR) repeat protein